MIKTIDHNINIDLLATIKPTLNIKIKKNDTNSHNFKMNINNGNIPYDLTGSEVKVYFKKQDGTKVFLSGVLDDPVNGKLSCLLSTQTTTYAGIVAFEVTVFGSDGEILTSLTCDFTVLDVLRDDEAIESTSDFTALQEVMAQVTGATKVTNSTTNGNILINNVESRVYDDTNIKNQIGGTVLTTTAKDITEAINELNAKPSTSVTSSTVNGKIKVNNVDVSVYDDTTIKSQLANNTQQLSTNTAKISTLSSGTPRTNYTTLALLQAGIPNGDIYSYVCTDGHRYYYNAGWQDGGVYQGLVPVDASVSKSSLNIDLQSTLFTEMSTAQNYVYKKTYTTNALNDQVATTFCGYSMVVTPPNKPITKISGSFKAGALCTLTCEIWSANMYSGILLATVDIPYTSATLGYQTLDFVFNNLDVSAQTVIAINIYVKDKSTWLGFANIVSNLSAIDISNTGNFNKYLKTTGVWTSLTLSTHYNYCLLLDIYTSKQAPNLAGVILPSDAIVNQVNLSPSLQNVLPIIIPTTVSESSNCLYTMNYIYVSLAYTSADVGFGITKFNDIWTANNAINDNTKSKRYTIIVAQGTYTDLQTRFTNITGTHYQGVNCKNYVYYMSEDTNRPDLCVIQWDGSTGFTSPKYADLFNKSPFHIIGDLSGGVHTFIKGFTFNCKNLRYCHHTETQSFGVDVDWLIENCVFNWGGCPNATDDTGSYPVIGLGSSPFERGKIKNCNIINTQSGNLGGIQNHDNVFGTVYGYTPFMVCGANIQIEGCNLNGLNIEFRSGYPNLYKTFNILELKNCKNINHAYLDFINGSTEQTWKAIIDACGITTNEMV